MSQIIFMNRMPQLRMDGKNPNLPFIATKPAPIGLNRKFDATDTFTDPIPQQNR